MQADTNTPAIEQIQVHITSQRLVIYFADKSSQRLVVSTASAGVGNQMDSYQTPLGWHAVSEKIGAGQPQGMIFKARQPTGELAEIVQQAKSTGEDLITSRILWLEGLEEGLNLGGRVDSKQRYIYIHGTHEEGLLGTPVSKGCIRMSNKDIIMLFDRVKVGTRVLIS